FDEGHQYTSEDDDDRDDDNEEVCSQYKGRDNTHLTQNELNDSVRDLGLPETGEEYLASELKRNNLVTKDGQRKIRGWFDKSETF
ncbi:hypothetical protein NQ318_000885, partial [Aromia moschata]